MNDIKAAFAEKNLDPGQVVLDGKIHRFKVASDDAKNSGWYVGFQNHTRKSGEIFQVVVFGNYRSDDTWTFQTSGVSLGAEDTRAMREQIAKAKKLQEAARARAQEIVAVEVARSWDALLKEGASEYLNKKQITECPNLGVRFNSKGDVHVPARDVDGRIWSWQRIYWDEFNKRFAKQFHAGGRVSGCLHLIGEIGGAKRLYVCEGFATGASIHLATGEPVAVAFTSGNLSQVAKSLKKRHEKLAIIVAGDDDRWKDPTKNPGREKANEAADASLGTAILPQFVNLDQQPTDFNDLHVLEGLEVVREQLTQMELRAPMALYALGFNEGEYFFTSTSNRQIVRVSSFGEDNLLKLMPLEYWEAVFPGDKVAVAWSRAKSELMQQCRTRGIFNMDKVRGAGVWEDEGRIVVNMGDHLLVDGTRVELGSLKSRFFYTLGEQLERLRENPLTKEECAVLVEACHLIRWARPKEAGTLLAGGLVTARVCGALPVRPHIWLTGGAQTGKSTIQEKLVHPILGANKLYVLGGTSEAGVRQGLKHNAVPVLFDEFETNDAKSAEHIASCIELMRAAWSNGGGSIVKGGQSGNAMFFQVRFSAIVSSIRTRLINDADKGRFAVLELGPHGSDENHWRQLSALLAQIDGEFSERLFARTISMLPILLSNYKRIKLALAKRADSRFGDQYGMLLAGYSILIYDSALTAQDAEDIAELVDLAEEKETAKQADHMDALDHLRTTKISYEAGGQRREALIGDLIARVLKSSKVAFQTGSVDSEKIALLNIGIKVDLENIAIVAANHAELEARVWRTTKWTMTWGNSLARLPGAQKNKSVWMTGIGNKKCIILPVSLFSEPPR